MHRGIAGFVEPMLKVEKSQETGARPFLFCTLGDCFVDLFIVVFVLFVFIVFFFFYGVCFVDLIVVLCLLLLLLLFFNCFLWPVLYSASFRRGLCTKALNFGQSA